MAKLPLWLITLSKNRPFTFLDHALRRGDSLLGVNLQQLTCWSMDAGRTHEQARQTVWIEPLIKEALDTALKLRRQIRALPEHDVRDIEAKARLLAEAKRQALLQDTLHAEYTVLVSANQEGRQQHFTAAGKAESRAAFNKLRKEVDALLNGRRPFHWPLEFPEVFTEGKEEERGFAAMVSNPPFQGGQKITGALGTDYRDYLVEYLANGKRGSADLCAYFFLRASRLVRQNGQCGLLATNTIAQDNTRVFDFDQLVAEGWTILRAVSSRRWPGVANLEVAHMWLRRGNWHGLHCLDEKQVKGITPHLTPLGVIQGKPYPLLSNAGKSFIGSYVLGAGFLLKPEDAHSLIEKDEHNKDILFPYLNGEDLNSRPDQSPSRWVINFHDWPLELTATYPDCISKLVEKVKPERDLNNIKFRRERWWQFATRAPNLYSAIAGMKRVLVRGEVSSHLTFSWHSTAAVFSHMLIVWSVEEDYFLTLLQSSIHGVWTLDYASTLGKGIRYTPTTTATLKSGRMLLRGEAHDHRSTNRNPD